MRFVKLIISNFKVFYGNQIIFFGNKNREGSNLFLIGGLNGAGKTTILQAVQLILFGEGKYSKLEFKKMMNGTLNNKYLEENGNKADLQLILESDHKLYTIKVTLYYNSNNEFSYMERRMNLPNKSIALTEKEIQTFINKNIPQDASIFFLFDGEKIQEIVDYQEEYSLKRSIQNIVSLEFYKNALVDIGKAKEKIERQFLNQVSESHIQKLKNEKQELEENINGTQEKLSYFKKRYLDADEKLKNIKRIKQKKLERLINSKDTLIKQQVKLEESLNHIQNELEEYAKNSLPKLILHPLIKEIQNRIKKEEQYKIKKQRQKIIFKQFDEFFQDFLENIDFINLNPHQKNMLFDIGKKIWAKHNDLIFEDIEDMEILHDLSEEEKKEILSINFSSLNIYSLIQKQNEYISKLEEINVKIENAPEADDLTEEEYQIEHITKTMGEYSLRIRSLQTKLAKYKSDLERINLKINELTKHLAINSSLKKQIDLIEKVYGAAKDFVENVTLFKADRIKKDFEYIINKLLRKSSDFSNIEFDINTYKINIFDHKGTLVQLKNRSAGEKQIIALSLIWALTKNASIDIPYIIDTPLGRLDSIHRKNLLEYYFPKLSNQVIILSTDTEVNEEFNKEISRYVNKSYRLDYDEKTKCTFIKEGYFLFR